MSDIWQIILGILFIFGIALFIDYSNNELKKSKQEEDNKKRKGIFRGTVTVTSRSDPQGYTVNVIAHVREEERIGDFSKLKVLSSNYPEVDYSLLNLIESNLIEWQDKS